MTDAAVAGDLPEWDLGDLYPSRDDRRVSMDLDACAERAAAFRAAFEGRIAGLSGADLGRAIAEYEAMDEVLARIMAFAHLLYAGNMADAEIGRFFQSMQERVNAISTQLLFFTLEINRIEEADLQARAAADELAHYGPWLRDTRAFRTHQLSDEVERLLLEKSVAGRAAWTRLFDETMARLRFPVDGRPLTTSQVLDRLSHADGDMRRKAAESLSSVLGENVGLFALITNTLAKDKSIEDRWRGYERPVSARNLSNQVEDEVVAALASAVRSRFGELSHRYYAVKARWLGVDKLNHWDRNAPLPEDDDTAIGWERARDIVLDAYRAFSPDMADIGRRFFDNAWIDAPVRPGKASGAFAHPTVPTAHPYLLLNYQGKTRDVMTLAHELGHGVHQVLSAGQGQLMCDTPLTLAETASVFGEMLTFQSLLRQTADPARRRVMLASMVEDRLNTVVRQIAFHGFEERLHDARREGELTPDQLGDLWIQVQRESLGPAFDFDDGYRVYWSYIPHFIHSPFYVYAYAFGDCLVNSLYAVYRGAESGFVDKYLAMLSAGGTLKHRELLAPFGLDASDPAFWNRGLDVVSGLIDDLQAEV